MHILSKFFFHHPQLTCKTFMLEKVVDKTVLCGCLDIFCLVVTISYITSRIFLFFFVYIHDFFFYYPKSFYLKKNKKQRRLREGPKKKVLTLFFCTNSSNGDKSNVHENEIGTVKTSTFFFFWFSLCVHFSYSFVFKTLTSFSSSNLSRNVSVLLSTSKSGTIF